jgi:hypothetical protein
LFDLINKPWPIEPPGGWNLTVAREPIPDQAEVALAWKWLQDRILPTLEELEIVRPIDPGRGRWRVFYGKAKPGDRLEKDPTPIVSRPVKRAGRSL